MIAVAPDFVKVYWRDAIVGDGTIGAEDLEHAPDPNEPVTAIALDRRLKQCCTTQIVGVGDGGICTQSALMAEIERDTAAISRGIIESTLRNNWQQEIRLPVAIEMQGNIATKNFLRPVGRVVVDKRPDTGEFVFHVG